MAARKRKDRIKRYFSVFLALFRGKFDSFESGTHGRKIQHINSCLSPARVRGVDWLGLKLHPPSDCR